MNLILELLSYSFIVKALIVGLLVSLCAALLGVSLVLKRYSMIGDGLAHVGFGSLAIAMAVNALPTLGIAINPLLVSFPIVVLSAFFLLKISENSYIKGDAAIGVISSSALALGVIVTALTKGMNLDISNYMFGSILTLSTADVYLSIISSMIVLIVYVLFYNKIFAVTFDEDFVAATGTNANFYKMLLAFLTAVTIVVGMRIMGTLLISSLIIFPALTAMRVCKCFSRVVITASVISIICFILGILISFKFEIPTGASIVMVNSLIFCLFSILSYILKR